MFGLCVCVYVSAFGVTGLRHNYYATAEGVSATVAAGAPGDISLHCVAQMHFAGVTSERLGFMQYVPMFVCLPLLLL